MSQKTKYFAAVMDKQAVRNVYNKDGQHRRVLLLQYKKPNSTNDACTINEAQLRKFGEQYSVRGTGLNPRKVGNQGDHFLKPKAPLGYKDYYSNRFTKHDKIIGKENPFKRIMTLNKTCEPGVHPRPLQWKEPNIKPNPRVLSKVRRRSSMVRKLDFDAADSCAYAANEPIVTTKVTTDARAISPVKTEQVPSLGVVEEVQTHFEVVEVLVVHDKASEGAQQSKELDAGVEPGDVGPLHGIREPLHEDNDTIRHYMRYEIVDGRRIKIYECGICRRGFKHQYTLMRHLPTHTDERNFPCQVCGKAFRQMSTLIQHGAIHSNARPYTCDICQNTFNRVSTLISHKKTHSNNKPHLCTYCGKRFHQKGNLRNHIFTHTNERPYKCGMCDKGFNQKSNLICHRIRYHTVKQEYVCEICKCKFPKKHALKNHQLYKHNIEYDSVKLTSEKANSDALVKNQANMFPSSDLADYVSNYKDTIVIDCGDNMSKTKGFSLDDGTAPSLYLNNISPDLDKVLVSGQIALVLFKPMGAAERLMKVVVDEHDKATLVPVLLADLKAVHGGGNEAQFDVNTVATFYQKYNEAGQLEIAEAGYPAVCQIKIEPIVQNLVVTKIQAWPGPTSSNNYACPFEYNPSSYQNNFNFPRFPSNSLFDQSDFSRMEIDEEFNATGYAPSMVDGEMITPELLDGISGYIDDQNVYGDGFHGQLDGLAGFHEVGGYGDPLGGVTGYDTGHVDESGTFVEYKYSAQPDEAIQLSLETVEVASEPVNPYFPLL